MILYEVGSGEPYSTIQDAIDAIVSPLTDYYKILVYDGTYAGFSVGSKIATVSNYITIEANSGDTVIVNSNITITSRYVYMVGFEITAAVLFSSGSNYSEVNNCIIHNYYAGSYLVEIVSGVRDVIVDSCLLYDSNNGVLISGALNNRVANCVARDIVGYGVTTDVGVVNPYVINNTIVDCGTGIRFRGEQTIRIRNNNITHNVNGIVMTAPLTQDNSVKSNNNVWNNSNNYIDTSGGINANSFDPSYINYSGNDFRLPVGSLCIDVGDSTDTPDHDFDGKSRPRLLGYDIGAFEYSTLNVAPSVIVNSLSQRTDGSGKIDIGFTGIDQNYDTCSLNLYEYSFTGNFTGEEETMTPSTTDAFHDNIDILVFIFTGENFNFVWDALADLDEGVEETTVYIRIRAYDGTVNGNMATYYGTVDTALPIISSFQIDDSKEVEENVTLDGIVDLLVTVTGNVTSMKFSNDGTDWSAYEAYAATKSDWNLISGNGGQSFQGLKNVYIKVKDSYGNETSGTLYDSTWYKLTAASVKNLITTTKYHSIGAALGAVNDNDALEIETDETFFETFTIANNGISIVAATGYSPSVNMLDRSAVSMSSVQDITIRGILFTNADNGIISISGSDDITIVKNIFEGNYPIYANPSTNITIDKNIFKEGIKSIQLSDCTDVTISNNIFYDVIDIAIELGQSPADIINNTFVDNITCIENLLPNDDKSTVRNNIFMGNDRVIVANPLWDIDHNDFWDNDEDFSGLVPRWEEYYNQSIDDIVHTNNIRRDPLFVDYLNDNFYLTVDSPCINIGSDDNVPDDDLNEVERRQDIGYDMGAYEFFPIPEYVYNASNVLQSDDVNNVFIYDTSLDGISSDWKQNIFRSWHIEKGDFPDIAYLIVTDDGLDIVNAADNTLWMKFISGTDNVIDGDTAINAIFALNGIIYCSKGEISSVHGGLVEIDFVSDVINNPRAISHYTYDSNISDRNAASGYTGSIGPGLKSAQVKAIHGARIDGDDFIAVASDDGVGVIKNLSSEISYAEGKDIGNVFVTTDDKLYYSAVVDGIVGVFYGISSDTGDKIPPDHSYSVTPSPATAPDILSSTINDIFVLVGESAYQVNEITLSNLLYVASDEGITIINTNEINPGTSENLGYSKHYGLQTSVNPKLDFKVFEGTVSDFYYLNVLGNVIFFVVKDTGNDVLYAYDRKSFNIRLERTTSLPSRIISGLNVIKLS